METFLDLLDDPSLFGRLGEHLRKAFLEKLYCYCAALPLEGVDLTEFAEGAEVVKVGYHTPKQLAEDSEIAKLLLTGLIIKCEDLPGRERAMVAAFLDEKAQNGTTNVELVSQRSLLLGLLAEVVLILTNCYRVGEETSTSSDTKKAGQKSARSKEAATKVVTPQSLLDPIDLVALTDFVSGQSLGVTDCGMPKPFTVVPTTRQSANDDDDDIYCPEAQLRAVDSQRREACLNGAYHIGMSHGLMSVVRALLLCSAVMYGTRPLPAQLEADSGGLFQQYATAEVLRGTESVVAERSAVRGPKVEIDWTTVQGLMGELDTLRRHFIKFLLTGMRCDGSSESAGADDGSSLLALVAHVFVTDLDSDKGVAWCLALQRCRVELFADIATYLVGDLCHLLGPATTESKNPFSCGPTFLKRIGQDGHFTVNAPVLHFGSDYLRPLTSEGGLGPHPLGSYCLDALRRATEAALDGLHAMSVSASIAQSSARYPHIAVIKASQLYRSRDAPQSINNDNHWVRHFFFACLPLAIGIRSLPTMLWLAKEFPAAYLHTAAVRAVPVGRLSVAALAHIDKELQVQGSIALVRGVVDSLRHGGDIQSAPQSDPLRPLLMIAPYILALSIHSVVYSGALWLHENLPDSDVNRSVKRSLSQVLGAATDEAPQLLYGAHSRDVGGAEVRLSAASAFLSNNLLQIAQGLASPNGDSMSNSTLDFTVSSLPFITGGAWELGDSALKVITKAANSLRASYFKNLQDERHIREVEQAKALRKASWAKTALGAMPLSAVAEAVIQSLLCLNVSESSLFHPPTNMRPDVVASMRSVESEAAKRPISKELFALLHREGHRQMQHMAALAAQEDELQRVSSSGAGDGGQRIPIGKMASVVSGGVHSIAHTKDRLTLLPPRAQLQCAAFASILRSMKSIGLMAARNQTVTPESTIRASHALVGRVLAQMPAAARDQAIDSLCSLLDSERRAVAEKNPDFPPTSMSVSNPFSAFSLCMTCLYMGAAQSSVAVYQRRLLTAAGSLEERGSARVLPISSIDPEHPLGWVTAAATDAFFEGDTMKQPNAYSHLAGRILAVLLECRTKDRRVLLQRPLKEFLSFAPHISRYMWSLIHRDLCLVDSPAQLPGPFRYTVITPRELVNSAPPSEFSIVGMQLLKHLVNNRLPYTCQALSSILYFSTGKKQGARRVALEVLNDILQSGRTDAPQVEALLLDHGASHAKKLESAFSGLGDKPPSLPVKLEQAVQAYLTAYKALETPVSDEQSSLLKSLEAVTTERAQAVRQYHAMLFHSTDHRDSLDLIDNLHRRLDLLFLLSAVSSKQYAHIVLERLLTVYAEAASVINPHPGNYIATLRVDTPLSAIMRDIMSSADVELLVRRAFGSLTTKSIQAAGKMWTIPDYAPQQRFIASVMPVLRKYPRGAEDLVVRVMGILASAVNSWITDVRRLLAELEFQGPDAPVATSKKDFQTILTMINNHCEYLSQKKSAIYLLQAARGGGGSDLIIASQVAGDVRMMLPVLSFLHPTDIATTVIPRLAKVLAVQHANNQLLSGKGEQFVGSYLTPDAVFGDMTHFAGSMRKIMTPLGSEGDLCPMPRSLLSTSSVFSLSFEETLWCILKREDLPRDVVVSPSKVSGPAAPPTAVSILLGLLHTNTVFADAVSAHSQGTKLPIPEAVARSVGFNDEDVADFVAACASTPSSYLEQCIRQMQFFSLGPVPNSPSGYAFGRSSPFPALAFYRRWGELERDMAAMLHNLGSHTARLHAQAMLDVLSQRTIERVAMNGQSVMSVGATQLFPIIGAEIQQRLRQIQRGEVGPALSAHALALRSGVVTALGALRALADITHYKLPVPELPANKLEMILEPPTAHTLPMGVVRPNDAAVAAVESKINSSTQTEIRAVAPAAPMVGSQEIQKLVHAHRATIQSIQPHATPTEQQVRREYYETQVLDAVLRGSLERFSADTVLTQTLETLKADRAICEQRYRALPRQ